jgi:cell wall-associated NlpC family hydrolase
MKTATRRLALLLRPVLLLALCAPGAAAADAGRRVSGFAVPPSGVIGVEEAQLRADYWIARIPDAQAVRMTPAQIAALNARLYAEDPSMHALAALPANWDRSTVLGWIGKLSSVPSRPLYLADGTLASADWLGSLQQALALDQVPETQPTRFGMVVRRASLRTFPDATRVFTDPQDHDIDRFQESALFPGTPVAIVHRSRDGRWLFVLAPNYAAWIDAQAVAEGTRAQVLGYAWKQPVRVITGASARTVYTPEDARVSALTLEMGQRLPVAEVPPGAVVNGQNAYTAWPLLLPVRNADASLAFVPALLPKVADSQAQPLPFTRANLLRQAFKFLGERYGWGHDYEARDCSGFVAEVYRSVGIELPRNTGDQARSPALTSRIAFTADDTRAARERVLATVKPGDLLYIPGHLMMVLGRVGGRLYVIHDIEGGSWLDAGGSLHRMHLNGVSVTPFEPLRFDEDTDFTDRLAYVLRIP